ncbi:hypothetical protein [Pseudomonas putida]|uniref:hypothetical protein n=1 Tax=Pseudomonas putida TaxID=303 RepID=UPI002DBBF171|nr:hypothetical protein [Pseudomonas putida]WRW03664.1 hypothetical protein VPZ82_29105 [Pseudomonas putida]
MKYISQLDRGPMILEVVGVGQLVSSRSNDRFEAVFYCRSVRSLKEKVWSGSSIYVTLPMDAIRALIPGSLWQYGRRISAHTFGGHWIDLSNYEVAYVDAVHHLRPEEVRQRLLHAKCPRTEFLSHINYVQFEGPHAKVIIPCAELFRHYLCPSKPYANFVLTSEFQSWLPRMLSSSSSSSSSSSFLMPAGRSKFSEKEISATALLSLSVSSVVSGVLPFKNLQVTSLNNSLITSRKNMLLKFMMPFGSHAELRVTGQTIKPSRQDKRQLHSLIVEKIHESAYAISPQNALQTEGLSAIATTPA